MTRRCSHCSNNGHNSRTCPSKGGGGSGGGGGGGVKLFGVRLTDGSIIKKSASMGNLSHYYSSNASSSSSPVNNSTSPCDDPPCVPVAQGYVSDDPAQASCSSNCRGERKKGVPWTEEEHRLFLMGLHKLGKGDWRGIARNFVITRTPTQVASHAQKYFNRQTNASRRKRRSSLFDMVPDMSMDPPSVPEEPEEPEELFMLHSSQPGETEHENPSTSLHLSLDPEPEPEPMETTSVETPADTVTHISFPPIIPTFFPTYLPVPFPFWPLSLFPTEEHKGQEISHHQVLRPTPIHSKNPVNVDELVGMSTLTLKEAGTSGRIEPSPLSIKLIGAPSRLSAFHPNQPASGSNLSKTSTNAIHAV